jgi:hypothetical protein
VDDDDRIRLLEAAKWRRETHRRTDQDFSTVVSEMLARYSVHQIAEVLAMREEDLRAILSDSYG